MPIKIVPIKSFLKTSQYRKEDNNLMKQNLMQQHNVGSLDQNVNWNVIRNTPADGDLHFLLEKLIITVTFAKKK